MLLCPGLVSVADRHRRTWTEMGKSAVRDTKSMDAIDCCSVVTCPTRTFGLGDAAVGGGRGYRGVLRSREDSSKNPKNAAVAEYGMVALVKSGAGILKFDCLHINYCLTGGVTRRRASLPL